ncbi:MAG: YbjN domain-containing protein [Erythrobacter sp.]|nr:YbjN domain-containing protein [Erythrobacter sp.]
MKSTCFGVLATVAGLCSAPVAAQDAGPASISANRPDALHKILVSAGYDAELIADREPGDGAVISINVEGGESFILLSDCDEAVPDACDTLVLSSAWDRDTPMSPERVAAANREFRYVSVWLDDDGDPYAQWAIVTRLAGIPAPVFLNTLQRYLRVVDDLADFVFEDDEVPGEANADNVEEG